MGAMERRQFLTTCAVLGGTGVLAFDAARTHQLLQDDDSVLRSLGVSAIARDEPVR
jgi:hypothetical protein